MAAVTSVFREFPPVGNFFFLFLPNLNVLEEVRSLDSPAPALFLTSFLMNLPPDQIRILIRSVLIIRVIAGDLITPRALLPRFARPARSPTTPGGPSAASAPSLRALAGAPSVFPVFVCVVVCAFPPSQTAQPEELIHHLRIKNQLYVAVDTPVESPLSDTPGSALTTLPGRVAVPPAILAVTTRSRFPISNSPVDAYDATLAEAAGYRNMALLSSLSRS